MKISVCCPSYKRPKVKTLDYLPFCKVYVDCKEYDEYKKQNPEGANIISVPEGVQGNLCRIRNYILDKELAENDVCLIIDDDLGGIFYFEKLKESRVEADEFLTFIEKYSIMAKDIGARFWGVNCNSDPQCYREYTPFSTTSYIGGPFQCFLKDNELRYDENLPLKEDYDMTLQQLNKYRVVLRINKYHYKCEQSTNAGGCATYRNIEREKEQLRMLQKKWGTKIVKIDTTDRSHSSKKTKKIDYNPVIRCPIKGV